MKLNKRLFLAAALTAAVGCGVTGCEDDNATCGMHASQCAPGQIFNYLECKCEGGSSETPAACEDANAERNASNECVCKSGFEKNESGACVASSTPAACEDANAERNESGECVCKANYTKDESGACVASSTPAACEDENAERNESGECVCKADFVKNEESGKCEAKAAVQPNCETDANAEIVDEVCVCKDGYVANADGVCEASVAPVPVQPNCETDANAEIVDEVCVCKEGYVANTDGVCEAESASCEDENAELDVNNECVCKADFVKNEESGKCEAVNTCDKTAESCAEYEDWNEAACSCDLKTSDTCDGTALDETEVCDNVNGVAVFAEGMGTCQAWFEQASKAGFIAEGETLVEDSSYAPSCGKGCMSLGKGSCETSVTILCGNGVVNAEAGEICDVDKDGNVIFADPSKATCSEANMGEEGVPGCASDCRGYSKGSCHESGETTDGTNDVASCGSNLSITDSTASATVKYTLVTAAEGNEVKAGIVCSSESATIAADVTNATLSAASEGTAELTADLSDLSVGSYACYVVVKAGDKGAVVCPLADAKPSKADGKVADLVDSTVAYNVAASGETLAIWNDFSASDMNTVLMSDAGMAPTDGSLTNATLKFVTMSGKTAKINKGQSADGSSIKAAVIGGAWAETEALTSETNSYLVIDGLAGASSISMTATTAGGHMVVMAGDTKVIEDFSAPKADKNTVWPAEDTVSGVIPADTTTLYIYAYGVGSGNLIIDNITIK